MGRGQLKIGQGRKQYRLLAQLRVVAEHINRQIVDISDLGRALSQSETAIWTTV